MSEYEVVRYTEKQTQEWDDLVLHHSVNGTFLQTRNFLNYHPAERFIDGSMLIYRKNRLVAVVPACEIHGKDGTGLYAHKGSTYGGIVVRQDYYKAERLLNIVKAVDKYVKNSYVQFVLKITPDIHSMKSSDLLQYILEYCGFKNYVELNTFVDLQNLSPDIRTSFDRNKIRSIRKCEEQRLSFRELENDTEIESFHNLLAINLEKFNLKPIHTVEEMKSFKHDRLPENVRFYGVFKDQAMMAGGMMFVFEQANVIHAQNLSADHRFGIYSPITYLYYRMIKQAREDGFRAISWGISTEEQGKVLNMGLIRNKESYGSQHQLNRTYYKTYRV